MKKIAILALLALVATGAFAQARVSLGGGLLMDYSANNGVLGSNFFSGERIFSIGGFVFFDATYIEVDLGISYGSVTFYHKEVNSLHTEDGGSYEQLNLALLVKYPFEMGKITLFPLFGIHYNRILSAKLPDDTKWVDAEELCSQFGILAGLGLDYHFTDAFFLRSEVLLHLRFPMKFYKDEADEWYDLTATVGAGPQIKIAVGYRF